jgi:hypothetical protein
MLSNKKGDISAPFFPCYRRIFSLKTWYDKWLDKKSITPHVFKPILALAFTVIRAFLTLTPCMPER